MAAATKKYVSWPMLGLLDDDDDVIMCERSCHVSTYSASLTSMYISPMLVRYIDGQSERVSEWNATYKNNNLREKRGLFQLAR